MKDTIVYIIIIIFLIIWIAVERTRNENAFGKGYDVGKQSQITDNISKGVMNPQGEWLPEFKLAVEKEK